MSSPRYNDVPLSSPPPAVPPSPGSLAKNLGGPSLFSSPLLPLPSSSRSLHSVGVKSQRWSQASVWETCCRGRRRRKGERGADGGRGLGPAPISSRGPRYSGLMGLTRSEKHRRVAAVVSVTVLIYWANFLLPPKKTWACLGLRGGGADWLAGRGDQERRRAGYALYVCTVSVYISVCVCNNLGSSCLCVCVLPWGIY